MATYDIKTPNEGYIDQVDLGRGSIIGPKDLIEHNE